MGPICSADVAGPLSLSSWVCDFCTQVYALCQVHTTFLAMQVSRLLQYSPVRRYSALQALTHPFFDELRNQSVTLPNGKPLHSAC